MRKQPKARTTKSKSRQDAFADIEERVSQQKRSCGSIIAGKNDPAWGQSSGDEKSI